MPDPCTVTASELIAPRRRRSCRSWTGRGRRRRRQPAPVRRPRPQPCQCRALRPRPQRHVTPGVGPGAAGLQPGARRIGFPAGGTAAAGLLPAVSAYMSRCSRMRAYAGAPIHAARLSAALRQHSFPQEEAARAAPKCSAWELADLFLGVFSLARNVSAVNEAELPAPNAAGGAARTGSLPLPGPSPRFAAAFWEASRAQLARETALADAALARRVRLASGRRALAGQGKAREGLSRQLQLGLVCPCVARGQMGPRC